jgi:hypothetical protein
MEEKVAWLYFLLNDLAYCAKNNLAEELFRDLKTHHPEAYQVYADIISNRKAKEVAALLKEPLC